MQRTIAIGGLARATGVKIPTIRYYESIGLLPAPPRSEGNRRLYDSSALKRLRFIRHARELGFEIETIRELLALAEQRHQSCETVDALANAHLDAVNARISRLKALRSELETMIRSCAKGRIAQCRILEALESHPPSNTQA